MRLYGTIGWYTALSLTGLKEISSSSFCIVIYTYTCMYILLIWVAGESAIAELLTTHYLLDRRTWRATRALKNRIGKAAT